jgi:FtsZ-interacting cell division protein ZipA
MPVWAWVLIAIGVVALVALIAWQLMTKQRTRKLRDQFGPEYERTVSSADSRRAAEAELAARKERREKLDIRPLSAEQRARYTADWQEVQAQFVDDPQGAVIRAGTMIQSVMADRGYPTEDFEQRAADVSVDHPRVVENYREGRRLFQKTSAGEGTTEDLRQAMRAYRKLFVELVEEGDPEADAADERRQQEVARR